MFPSLTMLFVSSPDPSPHQRQKPSNTDLCYKSEISSLMDFNSPDASLDKGTAGLSSAQIDQFLKVLSRKDKI